MLSSSREPGLTVAAVQTEATPGDLPRNVREAAAWVERAHRDGAELVVFPETHLTGYCHTYFDTAPPPADDLEWLSPLQHVVDQLQVVVLASAALARTGGNATISSILLSPGVSPAVVYDKQHLYDVERRWFTPGESGTTVDIDGHLLGLSLCYDANFPEHAAAAAAAGSDVLAYINAGAYFPGGEHRRDLHYASRALDNGHYVVFAGLVGAPYDFIGGSAIYDPFGRVVVRLGAGEGIAVAHLGADVVSAARTEQRMWADRRSTLGTRRTTTVTTRTGQRRS